MQCDHKDKCFVIPDSSHYQRVSIHSPSETSLTISNWTDGLILNNIDDNKSLIIIDENKLAIDDRYFVSYREKYDIDNIIITENGACFKDVVQDGRVHDNERISFFKDCSSR